MHDAPEATASFTAEGLLPQTAYRIFAAASDGERYSTVARLDMLTDAEPSRRLVQLVEATKTGFSYRLDADLDAHIFHTYLEKWAYDELWTAFAAQYPDNPDQALFLQSVLADFGFEVNGPQTVTWNAGDENILREGPATITGGKSYYALAAVADPDLGEWVGTPEAVEFALPDPDRSAATVEIELLDLQPELLKSRIVPDEGICFYFYHLFQKAVVDEFVAQFGQEAFENHIYEYGYVAEAPYTDLWRMEPGTEYLIAVFGVDRQGDVMYADKAFRAPQHRPEVVISLQPYENELQGYSDYETLELHVGFQHFDGVTHENAIWTLAMKEQLDETLAMMGDGATLEQCILEGYLYMMPITPEWYEQIQQTGTFTHIFEQVMPETEYVFVLATFDAGENLVVGSATAATPAEPAGTEPEEEYLALLGSWRLEGQSTEDWSSPLVYDLTVEQLTPNRSYLVRGWSRSDVGQEFPFVMNYDPNTKQAYINAPQYLGSSTVGGEECEVVFAGMFINGMTDNLSVYIAPTYKAYEVRVNDDRLAFMPELFRYEGRDYSFASLGYNGRTNAGFVAFEGDEYQPVNFRVRRAANASFVRTSGATPPVKGTGGSSSATAPKSNPSIPADAKLPASPGERPCLPRR